MKNETYLKQVKEIADRYKRFVGFNASESELKRLKEQIRQKGFVYRIRQGATTI